MRVWSAQAGRKPSWGSNLINQLAERGVAVVLISSELPELMAMSDRFLVMAEGRVAGELSKEEATEAKIMNLATTTYKTF